MATFSPSQVSAYISARIKGLTLQSGELRGPCPIHRGNNPNFAINPDSGEWFCQSKCGEGGDLYKLEGLILGVEFSAAKKSVDGLLGIELGPDPDRQTKPKPAVKEKAKITATHDYYDEDGRFLFQVVRWERPGEPKWFSQRRAGDDGGWVWGLTADWYKPLGKKDWKRGRETDRAARYFDDCRVVLYRLPELLAVTPDAGPVFVVEGEKDVENLRAMGLIATSNPQGAGKWRPEFADWLAGRDVIILQDNDEPGRDHARSVARSVYKSARSVKVRQLPGLPDKGDVSDWIAAGGTKEQLLALIADTPLWTTDGDLDDERPSILITTEEKSVNDQAVAALRRSPDIFQRGGSLCHIVTESNKPGAAQMVSGTPRPAVLPLAVLREQLSHVVAWKKMRQGVEGKAHPPDWAIRAVHCRGNWPGIRHLEGVMEVPFVRPDGTVHQTPGYDDQTGRLYIPNAPFPTVPENPTAEEIRAAVELLLEPFADFPFSSEAHRAAAIGGLLTLFAKPAFRGPSPMFLVDANVRGAGKTKLVDITHRIFTGRPIGRTPHAEDADEERKQITSFALQGASMVLIDNIARPLGSAVLDAVLTSDIWTDRALGGNEAIPIPLIATWFGTGNNVSFKGDTGRRVCHIRFDSPDERPEERQGFRHPNLDAWVIENRPRLVVATVTLLRGWFAAGAPDMGLKPWGSYEGWSRVVRNALVWAGLEDLGNTRGELETIADLEANALKNLLIHLEKASDSYGELVAFGQKAIGISKLLKLMELQIHEDELAPLKEAMADLVPSMKPKSIGMKLHHLRGRVVDGKKLDRIEHRTGSLWRVISVEERGTSGTKGTNSPLTQGNLAEPEYIYKSPTGGETTPASSASPAPGSKGTTPLAPLEGSEKFIGATTPDEVVV